MLANRRVADPKRRSLRAGVGHEAVRVKRELAVPVVGDLDLVEAAVVRTEEGLRARQRIELRIARLPLLRRTGTGVMPGRPSAVVVRVVDARARTAAIAAPIRARERTATLPFHFLGNANAVIVEPAGITTYCLPSSR